MKLATGADFATALNRGASLRLVLLYGPETGLTHERAKAAVKHFAGEAYQDPFRVSRLTGPALRADPARLADEIAALCFLGGRRVVWVEDVSDAIGGTAVEAVIVAPVGEGVAIIEAGDLPATSKLRKAADAAPHALSAASYPDAPRDLAELARRELAAAGLAIGDEALNRLVANLGVDRMVSLGEIRKLALYMNGRARVELADVLAALGDSSAISLEEIADAVAEGDLAALERGMSRATAAGEGAVRIARSTLAYFQKLRLIAELVAAGRTPANAIADLRPPIYPRQRSRMLDQVRRWDRQRLAAATTLLAGAEREAKTTGLPDAAAVGQRLLEAARLAIRPR